MAQDPTKASAPFSVAMLDSVKLANGGNVMKTTSDGKLAVIMEQSGTLHFVNLTDPTNIAEIGTYTRNIYGEGDLAIRGNYMYVTNYNENKIEIFDISDPTLPTNPKNFSLPYPYGIDIKDAYAYIGEDYADFGGIGAHLFEVNLTDPVNLANCTNVSLAFDNAYPVGHVEVLGNYAFAMNNPYPVNLVDISDPNNLVKKGNCSTGSFKDFTVSGNRVYIVDSVAFGSYYLYVFDITNPDNPNLLQMIYYSNLGRNFDFWCVDIVGSCAVVGDDNQVVFLSIKEPFATSESQFLLGTYTIGHYIFEVRALPQAGQFLTLDDTGNVTLFQCLNCIPLPSAPQNAAGSSAEGQIILTWQPPTSTGGASLLGYRIYRATKSGGPYSLVGSSTVEGFTDTSGTPGIIYYYVITAENIGGVGAYSNEVVVAMPGGIPGYPLEWILLICFTGATGVIYGTRKKQTL